MPRSTEPGVVVSCEHAGNRIPREYRPLFADARALLDSHRGYDAGAERIAGVLARELGVEPVLHGESRLLVDTNRSIDHPSVFSAFTRNLPAAERRAIAAAHHAPHRTRVEAEAARAIRAFGRCVHIGVHTFTPVLHGRVRALDVGLLCDPHRPFEIELVEGWRVQLASADPDLRIRRNLPYRGWTDGLTTTLRERLGTAYAGVELEVNRAEIDRPGWAPRLRRIAASAREALTGAGA